MSEWEETKLGEIAEYVTEKAPIDDVEPASYFSTENMLPNRGGVCIAATIPSYGKVTRIRCNDVLISNIRPYFKKIWRVRGKGTCSADVLCFRAKVGVDSRFLFQLLSADSFFDYMVAGAKGTKMPRGDKQHILEYPVSLPPLPTQRRIAAVLSALDDKIELNNRINANLEAQAQALFRSWFVDFEPWGGEMPEGWKTGVLGDICHFSTRRVPCGIATVDSYVSTESIRPDKQGIEKAASLPTTGMITAVEDKSVLVSNIRPYFRKIFKPDKPCFCSADVLCFVPDKPEFEMLLFESLWDDAFFAFVMQGAKGTKMPRGDKDQIMKYPVAIPDVATLHRFNDILVPMVSKVSHARRENRSLAALRDALLPKLMRGEIDVEKVEVAG